jgi:RNA-directed DNA polymerase
MNGPRQNTQRELARELSERGEAPITGDPGAESIVTGLAPESPAATLHLMEEVCERENLVRAWQRVRENKGAPGVDGRTIDDAKSYLREHWPDIRSHLLAGTYRPQPVKRVEIPKPDGGVRKLGVPSVVDRLIQQAVLQVLQKRWDPTFSEHSYGFRPRRSAHQAVAQAQLYVAEGYNVVVDFDLEKFFDRVNHDILMARVAERVADKRVLKLIRAFLNAGVMEDGLVRPVDEGTPQGGPLSPLLSNLVLNDLDKELERRGHRFCRYADDCNIYVRSRRAGKRVMASVSRFLTKRLKLKVNEAKSAVARPEERKFLGFSIANDGSERRIAPNALAKFKARIRELTRRTRGKSLPQVVEELKPYLTGWRSYFGFCQTPRVLTNLEAWIRQDCVCIFGGSGRTGPIASRSCAAEAFRNSLPRSPPVRRRASGARQDTRHFRRHSAITFSTLSACLASTLCVEAQPGRTAVVRDPYARWCGSCALQVRLTQPPEMAVAAKPSEQPRTKSCVASGNGRCEA